GSQGAAFLNAVADELGTADDRGFNMIQVTGADHYDAIESVAASHAGWVTVPFEEAMIDLYAACDVILCRGGAMTISEVEATHTPAIVVPLPAGKGYQGKNAADLVASGGGVVVEQTDVASVAAAARELMADSDRIERMRAAPRTVDHAEAASIVAARTLEVADA
ncbi:MAG: UDP-N-acetylglucosamine--N-acetylmuramyl-(pentapeptide) pyrophosphoryl-undecaprenol N-acetylglucosamine transferase, partial [Acidimicrobiia bacterium]